jgi:hypothetical protein
MQRMDVDNDLQPGPKLWQAAAIATSEPLSRK